LDLDHREFPQDSFVQARDDPVRKDPTTIYDENEPFGESFRVQRLGITWHCALLMV
jgi:hypothetical protein